MGPSTLFMCPSSIAIPTSADANDLAIQKDVCMEFFIVAVEVLLVEQLMVVDDEERRRSARIEVVFEATVGTVARDGVDLGGVGIGGGQLIEAGGGRCVVDGASGGISRDPCSRTCPGYQPASGRSVVPTDIQQRPRVA